MNASLKIPYMIALCWVLGGPIWWLGVWSALDQSVYGHLTPHVWRRVSRCMWCGAACLIVSGLAGVVRAASQVLDTGEIVAYWHFLSSTRYGQMTLVQVCLAPAVCGSFLLYPTRWWRLGYLGTALCGAGLLWSVSFAGHAAAKPGLLPLMTDAGHLFGAVVWAGSLWYLALLPWKALRHDVARAGRGLGQLLERFSTIALAAVLLLVISGAVLVFVQVYGVIALTETPYGRTLVLKVLLLLLALAVAGWQLLRTSPALQLQHRARAAVPEVVQALLGRCAMLVRVETLLVLGVLGCAAVLTTLPPAERPAQLTPLRWDTQAGAWPLTLALVPLGDTGQVQFGITLAQGQPPEAVREAQVSVHLRMQEHEMGTVRQRALPTAPGQYTMPGVISMAGTWEVAVTVQPPGQEAHTAQVSFEAATGLLEQDRERRLEPAAALASTVDMLSCALGGLFGMLAVLTIWASRSRRLPRWGIPFGCGLMLCAGYLVLRVLLVDAYPTTYWRNPLPASAEVRAQGRQVFQEHCTTCHGSEGQGDGPAAAALHPKPADLTAAHVDDHTDGTLFWWLTHGIPGTAMPAWEETLSETARWSAIHYIRSLRSRGP